MIQIYSDFVLNYYTHINVTIKGSSSTDSCAMNRISIQCVQGASPTAPSAYRVNVFIITHMSRFLTLPLTQFKSVNSLPISKYNLKNYVFIFCSLARRHFFAI